MERLSLGNLIPFHSPKSTAMKQLPDKTSKLLTLRQRKYCQARANGFNQAQAYLSAGYKPSSPINANKNAHNLEKHPDVAQYLARLREESFAKDVMSLQEKRSMLARIARTSPSEVDATSPICQEYAEEIDASGNVKRKVKLPSKIEAIRTDNQMAGHDWKNQQEEETNPFLFLVNFFGNGSQLPPKTFEAEIIKG